MDGEEEVAVAGPDDGEGAQGGRGGRLSRYVKVQLYLQLKEVVAVDELRLKLMKQGLDIGRSKLISEAIKLLAKEDMEAKLGVRG